MEPFKALIHDQLAFDLGDRVRRVWPSFPTRRFRAAVRGALEPLELKDRAKLVGESLWVSLPGSAAKNFAILTEAVETIPALGASVAQGELQTGWPMFPMDMILGEHGVEAFDPALEFSKAVTQRFTAEFGIRALLIHDPKRTLKTLQRWTKHKSLHVRRLVSEGTRPRLPWGQQIKAFVRDPSPTRPLLEALKDDPEEYVRRSVANHWNDVSKDHPESMLDAMEQWWEGAGKDRQRLVRHASRSLIKAGDARCLQMLGFGPPKLGSVVLDLNPKRFVLGGHLEAQVSLESSAPGEQNLLVDFRFQLIKKNGQTAPKVFKGKTLVVPGLASREVIQRFPLRPVTTRAYYGGKTNVELLVNGVVVATSAFELIVP